MLQRKKEKTIYFGSECISSLAPKIWELFPGPLKNEIGHNSFKLKIKFWVTDKCPCRLCKKYVGNMGFTIITDTDVMTETYSEPWYTSKMKLFVKLVNSFQPLPISAKNYVLDIWHGSGYVSILWAGLTDVQLLEKKSNFMWYFVKLSHSRLLRRKNFFDVNSAKKRVSISVKQSATYIYRQIKTQLIRYQVSYFFTTNVLFM